MSQADLPDQDGTEEPDLEPTDRTIDLFHEFEEENADLCERDDTIGALARAHRRVVTGDADV